MNATDDDEAPTDIKPGDTIMFTGPPPMTRWERFLWRWFRIDRKRQNVTRTFVVSAVASHTSRTPQDMGGIEIVEP
jgi:hypothetical protein